MKKQERKWREAKEHPRTNRKTSTQIFFLGEPLRASESVLEGIISRIIVRVRYNYDTRRRDLSPPPASADQLLHGRS